MLPITKEEIAEAVRAWLAAYDTHDVEALVAMEAGSFGFGFRSFTARREGRVARDILERFFATVDYYRAVPEDFETSVRGDLGMAWGTFVEEFQHKGQQPERALVRFSNVMTKGPEGWRVLLYHRDIQPFTEEGLYPKTLTTISSAD
jgi:ketosteroid isomerase-like protein